MTAIATSPTLLAKTVSTTAGVTHIDLNFSVTMAKGRGSIFVTDGAVQTVIDRVTGEPKLRVVGASFTKEVPLSQVTVNGSHVSFDAAGLATGKHYSIFMGAGTLTSGGAPFAGYTVPNQVAFDIPATTPPPPAISATFVFEQTVLKAGQDIEAFVTLSRSVTGLNASAFSAENASVKSVTATDNPLVWKVVLTKSASIADAVNALSLDLSMVEIAAGVHGSGTATSPNYAVDTLVNPWISAAGSAHDTGVSDTDNLVSSHWAGVSGELHGGMDGGDSIELLINGVAVDPADISINHDRSPWTWSYEPEEGDDVVWLEDGANTIVVRVKNGEHTSADYTTTITVDATDPVITASPEGATSLSLNNDFTISFSEKLYWQPGEGGVDMQVSIYCIEDDTYQQIDIDPAPFQTGSDTLTLSPAALGLDPGKHYELALPGSLTDKAGNDLWDNPITFKTSGPANATHAVVDGKLAYKAGDKITFRIKFDEDVRPTSDAILSLGLSNGQRAAVQSVDGDEWTFAYTVEAGVGVDTNDLTISDFSLLVDNVEDLEDFPLTGAHILIDGIHQYAGSGYGYLPVDIVVDTVAPAAPGTPSLASGSDSGALGDNRTNVLKPTLTGSGESGAVVSIYDGGTLLGADRVDSGNWTIQVGSNLAAGLHNLTIVQTDRAGNVSSSTSYALTIESSVPSLAAPVLANDTGSSSSDRLTNDTTLEGSGALANAHIKIMSGADIVGVGTADADGNWTAVFGSSLPDGEHTYTVRQVDAAGNTSADSPAITFTVDRSAPGVPSGTPDLAAASDSGASNTDNVTNEREPTFNGSGALANTGVALFANGVEIGRTAADASGNWTYKVPGAKALGDGTYAITVRQFDTAGNMSGDSMALSITVDNVGPSAGVASVNVFGRKFSLPFSEAIVFQPGGRFNLFEGSTERDAYWGNNNSSWSVTADSDGDLSILNFNISLNGLLRMQWNNGSVTDLAGNAAIVGVSGWDFEMPTTS